jgi:prolyl-tRNA synthetase
MTLKYSQHKNESQWYNEIITKANIAEYSKIKGFMIIKPYGFAIWENIQHILNKMLKKTGHKNCYFPLLIPKSYLSKEHDHVKGFAKECAIVTHNKLINKNNKITIDKSSILTEELIIRPTSEAIIWPTFNKWVQSYKDLPILINQWANVIRCEMKTKFFLRTSEFLWQEGHTIHETKQEALLEIKQVMNIYKKFIEKYLCIPVIKGVKSEYEKFAGADKTYCLEAVMKNGKALQIATSHFLGQNFSKAFKVKFIDRKGKLQFPWGTSWGVSTRLIGALIMTHSDDKGLILPPKIAPIKIVIIPIYKNMQELNMINIYIHNIIKILKIKKLNFYYDNRTTYSPGWKFNEYEIQGIPIRMNIGKNEVQNQTVELIRRDEKNIKQIINITNMIKKIFFILKDMQNTILKKAQNNTKKFIHFVDNYKDFKKTLQKKRGFILANWDGDVNTEIHIKQETQATIRCIIKNNKKYKKKKCFFSGKKSKKLVFFAKSY